MSDKSGADQPPKGNAWVTLATNDTYALGAIVLARSLNQVGTKYAKCVMITDSVSKSMTDLLKKNFENVVVVDLLDSGDTFHLAMLARPELGVTFTKIHCWLRTEYEKCVFLDADTLVLEKSDELFEREELSAAPDVGWPDCFNSGVFVFRPSEATFASIASFALENKSFDGGDQGLLNLYFKNWSLEGPDKRLPFFYNMCSTACYSYLPAFKMYGGGAKIIHFIGPRKPWTFSMNPLTRIVDSGEFSHLAEYIQKWWDLCFETVFPQLSPDMEDDDEAGGSSVRRPLKSRMVDDKQASGSTGKRSATSRMATSTTLRSETSIGSITPIALQSTPEFLHPFVDPWDAYMAINTTNLNPKDQEQNSEKETQGHTVTNHCENDEHVDDFTNTNSISKLDFHNCRDSDWDDLKLSNIVLVDKSSPISYPYKNCNLNGKSNNLEASPGSSQAKESSAIDHSIKTSPKNLTENVWGTYTSHSFKTTVDVPSVQVTTPPSVQTPSSHTCIDVNTKVNAGDDSICLTNDDETNETGLPGTLSRLSVSDRPGGSLEEHWRRTAWESSSADYMGRDSFDKVWEKIQSTMEKPSEVVPDIQQPASSSSNTEESGDGKTLASGDSEKVVQAEPPANEPKGAPLADAPSAAVATPPLPSALVDVDSSSASSNLGSLAQTVSQAVAPSLSSLEPSLPPADSELDALTLGQVVTGEPSVALDVLGEDPLSSEVASSPIPVESDKPEQPGETTEPAIPIPAQSDSILPILPAETLATEQPSVSILAASGPDQTEPAPEPHVTEQPAIPLPAPLSSPLELPAETHEIETAISAVSNEPTIIPRQDTVEAEGEVPSVAGDPQLEPVPVPSEPLPPQPVPRTPTVIEATPPTSPPIGQPGAFPLASSAPIPALVGAALSKEQAETAPASQSDAEAAPIPPKRRGGPSKGGKSAVQKGKK